ncbi:MAG TPA: hypothetical protein VGD25_03455, partial [Immundisolibacter sp.]
MANPPKAPVRVETLTHDEATRKNIPTAEYQSVMIDEHKHPLRVAYERRNRDLDPQLVWRGKDVQDWSDPGSQAGASLIVHAPPVYIQEKVHPKVIIDDLRKVASGQWSVTGHQPPATGHRPLTTEVR